MPLERQPQRRAREGLAGDGLGDDATPAGRVQRRPCPHGDRARHERDDLKPLVRESP